MSGTGTFTVLDGVAFAGTLAIDVVGTGSGSATRLTVGGALDLSAGTSSLVFTTTGTLDDTAYVFATYGSLSRTLATVSNLPTGHALDYDYLGGNTIALVAIPVPEPATCTLAIGAGSAFPVRARPRSPPHDEICSAEGGT